ncbi:MAG: hypothetical protein QOI66_1341 [Myxococcales bacterium]|jgi:hypothetical protein|nr:hypothetical protein [Myxococcales bacterium]
MKTETLSYHASSGWSVPALPALDSERTLVVVFGAPSAIDNPAPIQELIAAYPRSRVLGCSTAGEIFGRTINDESLSVAVTRFENTGLRLASAPIGGTHDSTTAGRTVAAALLAPDLRGVIVLSDGINTNGSELLRGLNAVLPASVVVVGGLAGDGSRFAHTWVLHDGTPSVGWVSAVGLYGDRISIGHGSKGGWDIFGPERTVTRSVGNVLHEIDGRPALDLYKEYLGELAAGLPATALLFPLSLRRNKGDEMRLVRTILAVSDADKSMTFAGDIPGGALVQLMRANFDRLIDGAVDAARHVHQGLVETSGSLTIAISCVGRRLVLGERAEEEVEGVMDNLPAASQMVGFYSYGEISPFVVSGPCELHNQTMTLTHLVER